MTTTWQQQISAANIKSRDLLDQTSVAPSAIPDAGEDNSPDFSLKAPQAWIQRIRKGDSNDPLLKQVLPDLLERKTAAGFNKDPVGDLSKYLGDGIIHKYHKRVLLIVTGACAIHCRYCFRRHFPYQENALAAHLPAALERIENDSEIEEVILSGGDPLTLSNRKLFDLCERLEAIPHIKRIRIHTRLPIAVPDRIDAEFVQWSKQRSKSYIMVMHINHPDEIDSAVADKAAQLSHLTLLNQAVLLKGVNDDSDVLVRLSTACFEIGVLPYYLHLLDPVEGAAHFEVDEETARDLMRTVSRELPGYLVPKLAREVSGDPAKRIIALW